MHAIIILGEISLILFLKFTYLFWERARHEQGKGREKEQILRRLHTTSMEPDAGLKLINGEIMTWAEIKSLTLTGWATQVSLSCCLYIIGRSTKVAVFSETLFIDNHKIYMPLSLTILPLGLCP